MSRLENKKALITGATGFVGSHLAIKLVEEGADTTALVRKSSDQKIIKKLQDAGVKVVFGDVTNRDSVFEAAKGKDFIFHIAALFRQAKHPDSVYWDINVEGTRNVLDAAEENNVERMLHCSTIGVHSHIINPPANEDEDYRPADIYQVTKCEGEKLAKERFENGRIKGAVIRPAMIWGDGDKRMLKLFKGVAKRRFPIIGNGKTYMHWIYVHDLVESFILGAIREEAIGQTYIIAGNRPTTISELVELVAKQAKVKPLPFKVPALPVQILGSLTELICKPVGIEPPIYRRRVDFFTKDRSFDISKAQKELGFKAKQDFEQEVEKIYHWYESNGWL